MKDLDFDELDRAVNSIITGGGTPAGVDAAAKASDTSSSSVGSWAQPRGLSEPTQPIAAPKVQAAPAQSRPLAARRSSGRFMDVVHPSSDMRNAAIPTRPTSREGFAIASPSTNSPAVSENLPFAQPTTPWTQASVSSVVESTPKPEVGDWPDPLDFTGYGAADVEKAPAEQPAVQSQWDAQPDTDVEDDKDINQIADAINKTLGKDQNEQAPLESPFLTDAKVNKRPLGAFSVDDAPSLPAIEAPEEALLLEAEPSAMPVIDVTSADQVGDLSPADAPLPAELQRDLLSIESTAETVSQSMGSAAPVSAAPQPEANLGATSIAQQYTEKPSTGDQPTGAIFDTQAYRKPLAHPAKKKSGWWMLLWIFLLLIVGAGAGAAVYFFVLPLL